MAKVKLDPMFTSYEGRLGNDVYYTRWGKNYMRTYTRPFNPDTAGQRKNRDLFRDAMKSWQHLTDDEKYIYNRKARKLTMSGHNLYISQYMKKHNTEERITVSVPGTVSITRSSGHRHPFKMKRSGYVTAPCMLKDCFYPSPVMFQYPPG
jgi:hypothetical protein